MKQILIAVIVLLAAGAARAEEAQPVSPNYQAAEIRLVKARLRQLEEKVAREERAVRKITHKCRAHFKRTIVIRIYER